MLKTLAFVAALLPTPILADPCAELGQLAAGIMELRQMGTPVNELFNLFNGPETPPESRALMRQMILLAYDMPRFSTERIKSEAAADFANQYMIVCYNAAQP